MLSQRRRSSDIVATTDNGNYVLVNGRHGSNSRKGGLPVDGVAGGDNSSRSSSLVSVSSSKHQSPASAENPDAEDMALSACGSEKGCDKAGKLKNGVGATSDKSASKAHTKLNGELNVNGVGEHGHPSSHSSSTTSSTERPKKGKWEETCRRVYDERVDCETNCKKPIDRSTDEPIEMCITRLLLSFTLRSGYA